MSRQRTNTPNSSGAPTQLAPLLSNHPAQDSPSPELREPFPRVQETRQRSGDEATPRKRGAPRGNANARRHGLYSAPAQSHPERSAAQSHPERSAAQSHPERSAAQSKDAWSEARSKDDAGPHIDAPGLDAPELAHAEHNLQTMLAYQATLDPASDWERYQAAQTVITRLYNTLRRLRDGALAQRRLELAERKLELQQDLATYAARKVAVAEQRLALDISLARAAQRRHLQQSVERDMRAARKGIPATPPRNAAEWERFERTYAAAHPETRPPTAKPTAEKNENIEEQFPFPARPHPERSAAQSKDAPIPPAAAAPTSHYAAHPESRAPVQPLAEKNEKVEEQIARPPAPIWPAQDIPADAIRHPFTPSPVHPFSSSPATPLDESDDFAAADDPDEPIVGDADAVYGFEAHRARVEAQVRAAQAYWRQTQEQAASPGRTGETHPPVTEK